MTAPLFQRIADGFGSEGATELRVRIYRLTCGLTAGLCLGVVAPLNLVQNLPWGVDVANIVLGLVGALCYWQSCRGRHYYFLYLLFLVGSLDFVWFLNAGSDGSVTHYYYPVMLFVVTLFLGWTRWLLALGLWLNVALLFIVEHYFPGWVVPFHSPHDRLVDLETGVFCSFMALGAVTWFVLENYKREQRRVAEIAAQLAASEANYREIFNSTNDALFVHDPAGQILDVNEQACALFAADRAQLLGDTMDDFSLGQSPYSQVEAVAHLKRAMQGEPQLFEWRSRRINGELFWSEVALRVWEIGGEQRVVAAVRDITARKQAQEYLRQNEERLRLAMEASHQGWFELNIRTGETVSSPEYIRMLEYEPAEFHSNLQAWIERIHPADREKTVQGYRQGAEGGKLGSLEYRQQTKSGGWKWFRTVAKVVESDAAGRPLRLMGTHTDITERKELEAQLLHSQRLEAIGTLASGVAHDLNNILTPMLMASGVLSEKLTEAKDRELMALLDEGGRRGAAIVRQLLAFSRNLAQDRVPVDLRELLRDMTQLMQATFPKEIAIVDAFAGDQGLVEAEPNQMHQVLMNLCVNARDAMPGGGTLTLGLERVQLPAGGGSKGGPHVMFSVTDTGHGIPPDILDRIFDPFFTTKPLGKGTGLGLASVHGIIKAHHGLVRVESAPGRGTTFRVYLPAREGPAGVGARPVAPVARPVAAAPATAAVLVVDDDPGVLMMTSQVVTRLGYQVLEANGGIEALHQLRQHRESVILVITDFSMPGMDGPTLVPQLLAIAPTLRIIGVSGLNQDHRAAELAALGFSEILSKPYELADLVRTLQRHLPRAQ